MKLKKKHIGKKARIIGNSNVHKFEIGETVLIEKISKSGRTFICTDSSDSWYIIPQDLKLIKPEKKAGLKRIESLLIEINNKL